MARLKVVQRQARGLFGQWNPYETPEGALLEAENVVIDREHVISKRRGFDRYGDQLGTAPISMLDFKNRVIVLDGTTLKYDSDGAGTWTSWTGSFVSPASDRRLRGIEARSNLYMVTSNGIYKNDKLTNNPVKAGLPRSAVTANRSALDTGTGWLADTQFVGYRAVFERTDANGFLILSAPSERVIHENSSGATQNPGIRIYIPPDVVSGDKVRLYRTEAAASASTIGDKYLLAESRDLVAADITAEFKEWTDTIDEGFLGDSLYTNPQQETITKENGVPPFALDLVTFKGHTFYSNTRQPHQLVVTLQDIDVWADGNTLRVDIGASNWTFTARTAPAVPFDFLLEKTLPTESENIEATMRAFSEEVASLVTAQSILFLAEYTSGENDPPGKIRLYDLDFSTDTITMIANSTTIGNTFEPKLTTVASTTEQSTQDSFVNRLYRSKFEQPDAVPFFNFDSIGSEESPIIRILKLRDTLIILKEEGVWRLTGERESDFVIKELDPSVKLLVPDTAVVLNNAVFCMSQQGVVRISERDVEIVSRPIEKDLDVLQTLSNFDSLTHAVAYEEDRKYILWTPETLSDAVAPIAWTYNYLTQAWTTWRKKSKVAMVLFDTDLLYVSHGVDFYVLKERKQLVQGSQQDFSDETLTLTFQNVTTTTASDGSTVTQLDVTYSYTGATLMSGWLFEYQTQQSMVEVAVDNLDGTYTLTLRDLLDLPLGVTGNPGSFRGLLELTGVSMGAGGGVVTFLADLSIPILSTVSWSPEVAKDPSSLKHFVFCILSMEANLASKHRLGFATDFFPDVEFVSDISTSLQAGWGQGAWGTSPWGGSASPSTAIRTAIPRNHQRCRQLAVTYKHERASETFNILHMALSMLYTSERVARTPR